MQSAARIVALAFLSALAGCEAMSNPAQQTPDTGSRTAAAEAVPGQYIVVLQDNVANPATVARDLVNASGGSLLRVYSSALKGFAARLSAAAATALGSNPLVASVEPDQVMRADVTQSMDANGDPWGLDRIDQGALPLSRTYTYTSTGAGVHAYIIDTGIWTLHPEFGGRANNVFDAYGATGEDCNGHGTHVSGTIGAATYGVAKGVSLHGVRVLSCAGLGLNSDVIAGVDWVSANHVNPAVANMSLGGGKSPALDQAVTSLWNSGVFLAVAAGNDNVDACTVGCSQRLHRRRVDQDRRQGVVLQLGYVRRGVRPRIRDRVDVSGRYDHEPQRHLDGHAACGRCRGALQGDQWQPAVRNGRELADHERHVGRDHGQSVGDAKPAVVQVDTVVLSQSR